MYHKIPDGKADEVINAYIDVIAAAGVSDFFLNTNAQRTNYCSHVWESFWDGYEQSGNDDQFFLKPLSAESNKIYRKLLDNMLAVYQQGIDYPAQVIKRCCDHGISPWISLRMNDCHYNDIPDHPFHGKFWKKNPHFIRQNAEGYFAGCLDYEREEVRSHYMALIEETLERYDIDGLELDFLREPYIFSRGRENEGANILTSWITELRNRVFHAADRRGHPVKLCIRVPSDPETAQGMGFNIPEWLNRKLLDVLVVAPRWATLEFDIPIEKWREIPGMLDITLAAGLEILYRPYPEYAPVIVSPELARGAAALLLSKGADAIYLFNYFQDGHANGKWALPVYKETLDSMNSLEVLKQMSRSVGVTYKDICAPGENYQPCLPAQGKEIMLSIAIDSIPDRTQICTLSLVISLSEDITVTIPSVLINGKACIFQKEERRDKERIIIFEINTAALIDKLSQKINISSTDGNELKIEGLEMKIIAISGGGVHLHETAPAS